MTGSPLVSCIMPTAQRPQFVPLAVHYFLRQTYGNRELIVIDDGAEGVNWLLPPIPSIRYYRLERRANIGVKRNIACDLAKGDIIAHWDDDDWTAPSRLSFQVAAMAAAGAAASGLSSIRFFDPARRSAWLFNDASSQWLAGSSLCYEKALWSRSHFREAERGEDLAFVLDVGRAQFVDLNDAPLIVALIHDSNTSSRPGAGPGWRKVNVSEIGELLGSDVALYGRDLVRSTCARGGS
jgi:glycosyltransferase involved in cell wall biosynthesis